MLRLILTRPAFASTLLVALVSLWHLFLAGQAGLSVDEAHYALYALKPDWSYFDHPPMVGWLQMPFAWTGKSETWLRVLPIALYAVTQHLLYRLCFRLFDTPHPWLGFWSLVLINSTLMFPLLGMAMLPEAPLLVFALLSLLTLLRLRESAKLSDWLWLGVWIGLAGLSKYTAVTLVFSILLVIMFEQRWRWLLTPGPWLAVLLAFLLISPVLYWNIQHDWISFSYQLEHGTRDPNWSWLRALASQGAQFVVYSPLLYLVGLSLLILGSWRQPNIRLLWLFAVPILLLFAYGSGHKLTLPHWTALAWLVITPIVANWLIQHWHQAWLRIVVYVNGALMLTLALILNSLILFPWLVSGPSHPLQDLYGWPKAYERAQYWQTQLEQQNGIKPPLFVTNWTHASRLAWYAYPEVVYVNDTRYDQFDLWFSEPAAQTQGLVIAPDYADPLTFDQPGHFQHCNLLETVDQIQQGVTLVRFALYHCEGYQPVKR